MVYRSKSKGTACSNSNKDSLSRKRHCSAAEGFPPMLLIDLEGIGHQSGNLEGRLEQ